MSGFLRHRSSEKFGRELKSEISDSDSDSKESYGLQVAGCLTSPFTILGPQNPLIYVANFMSFKNVMRRILRPKNRERARRVSVFVWKHDRTILNYCSSKIRRSANFHYELQKSRSTVFTLRNLIVLGRQGLSETLPTLSQFWSF